ncbi:MAG: DUF1501 domain-containing protein [Gammaproteobacteria bacterium]|nr:DUF1501 domain-containing protein [Gammaproteobacteria bacterium]
MRRREFIKQMLFSSMALTASRFSHALPIAQTQQQWLDSLDIRYNKLERSQLSRHIFIFLYGGASELVGNLSNLAEMQKKEANVRYSGIFDGPGAITNDYFWRDAGGNILQRMLDAGDASVYRTMYRKLDDNRAHFRSQSQNLKGATDMDKPGLAATLAYLIQRFELLESLAPADELQLPFISFDADPRVFAGSFVAAQQFQAVGLTGQSQHPYAAVRLNNFDANVDDRFRDFIRAKIRSSTADTELKQLLQKRDVYNQILTQMLDEDAIKLKINQFSGRLLPADAINYADNLIAKQLRSAVSLMLENPQTLFAFIGEGAGTWDDHSSALDVYPIRMRQLMEAINNAVRHLKGARLAGVSHAGQIKIHIISEFGRNLVLNNAKGWDHGNNGNYMTFAGWDVRSDLGKVVGRTELAQEGVTRIYTRPTASSYTFEPFALASSIYQDFGIQNPQVITGVNAINQFA